MTVVAAPEPTRGVAPAPPRARARSRARARVVVVAVTTGVLAAAVLAAQIGARGLGREPFFDEMWRLDLVRSAEPFAEFLPGTAPLPPGWVWGFRLLAPLLGTAPVGYRLASLAMAGAGVAILVVLLFAWCRPRARRDGSDGVALATAAAGALSLTVFALVTGITYLNQYLFEVSYAVALTTCCVLLGRHRAAFPCFVAGTALAPVFVIAPMALLPALLVASACWAATADRERRAWRLTALVASGAVALIGALAVHAGLYRSMGAAAELRDAWAPATVSHSGGDPLLVGDTLDRVRAAVLGDAIASGAGGALAAAVLGAAFVVGAVTITRRWAWYPLLAGSGWVALLAASAVTGGPATPVRVTVGFYWLVLATIALGCFRSVAWVAGRVSGGAALPVGAVVVTLAVALAALWPGRDAEESSRFARGLLADLDPVVASPTRDNLVLTYHFMAHTYTHDRLVNRAPARREYVVLGQRDRRDGRLFRDVDALVRRHLPDGGTLWCVVPYALGPADSGRACRVTVDVREIERDPGAQAWVIGYAVARPARR